MPCNMVLSTYSSCIISAIQSKKMWYLSKCLTVMPTKKNWFTNTVGTRMLQQTALKVNYHRQVFKQILVEINLRRNYMNFLTRILMKAYLNILNNKTISQVEWPWDILKSPWKTCSLSSCWTSVPPCWHALCFGLD